MLTETCQVHVLTKLNCVFVSMSVCLHLCVCFVTKLLQKGHSENLVPGQVGCSTSSAILSSEQLSNSKIIEQVAIYFWYPNCLPTIFLVPLYKNETIKSGMG